MVDKEVKFTIKLDDQATSKLREIKSQMDSIQGSSQSITASTGMGARTSETPVTSGAKKGFDPESGFKWGASENISDYQKAVQKNMDERAAMAQKQKQTTSKKTPAAPGSQMFPEEWGRPLRAVGAYRSAWFAGQDTSAGPMKAAAGIFILQAVADTAQKILKVLEEASPALSAEIKIFKVAMNETLRPMGDLLATVLRPISRAMLQANVYARSSMAKEGIPQTDLSEYYARYTASMGALISGEEVLGENAVDLSNTIDALDVLFTVLGATTLPGLIISIYNFIQWFDENKDLFPIWGGAVTGMMNNVVALEVPMTNLTNTVKSLDDAMQNLAPVIDVITDSAGSVGNALDKLGDLGDVGKGTLDKIGSIGEGIYNFIL